MCVSSYATITVGGISEVGDTPTTTATIQTIGAVAGGMIFVAYATQGSGCPVTNITWLSNTATATTSGAGCISLPNGTIVCLGDTNPIAYAGCYSSTGSSSTTMQFALASNPGAFVSSGGFTINGIAPVDTASNAYVEVPGCRAYVNMTCWFASNITLASGSTQPTITCSLANSHFTGIACGDVTVSGLGTTPSVDVVSADFSHGLSSATAIPTQSIAGNVSSEFFFAWATTGNALNNLISACGGQTWTDFDAPIGGGNHDGIGGYPAAYFISSGTGTFCAGLNQNIAGPWWPVVVSFKAGSTGPVASGYIGNGAVISGGAIVR